MMRRLALALALWLAAVPAIGQMATIAPNVPPGDNSDRIANTNFVQNAVSTPSLATGLIFIGNVSGFAQARTMSGDCTISVTGVVTCTQSAGAFTVNGTLTVNGAIIDTSGNATLKTVILPGSTSGSVTLKSAAVAGANTLTFPAGTTDFSATGGTSQFVKQATAGGPLTVAQVSFSDLLGQGTCAQEPALTGDVTSSAGSCATTIAANAVTNAKAAQGPANTLKGNPTGSTANEQDVTLPASMSFSGSALQTAAHTGDATSAANSNAMTLANIPSGVPMAGSILGTNTAAPTTPAAGKDSIWTDSTDLRLHDKNASGVIGTTVVSDAGAANNFLTGISVAGAVTKAQPTFTNLGGTLLSAQMPALTGDVTNSGLATTIAAGVVTYAKMQNVAASRLLGNASGSPAAPAEISLASSLAFSVGTLTTSALTGDVTAAVGGTVTTIAANAVTNAKAAQGGANTVKGNFTAGTANEADNAVPSCSGANQALTYTSGTGLGCVTISAGTSKQIMTGGSLASGIGTGATQYSGFSGQFTGTEVNAQTPIAISGTFKNLNVAITADPGNLNTVALTMRKNGVSQTLTCTITGNGTTAKTCSDSAHSFTVAAGDLVVLQDANSTISGSSILAWSVEFDNP